MKIQLDLIQPSPHPVRTQWDDDRLNELAQSIKELGVIVPIKVRPTYGNGVLWEVVYGHRRVEAARRAGLKEIPATQEVLGDRQSYIEALVENIQRDDMTDIELSEALNQLRDEAGQSLSSSQIKKLVGLSETRITTLINLTKSHSDIADTFVAEITNRALKHDLGKVSQFKDLATKARFIGEKIKEPELRREVAKKVIDEDLSQQKTMEIAKRVKEAKDMAEKQAIIETPFEHVVTSPEFIQAKAEAKRKREKEVRKKQEEQPRSVKVYIEAIKVFSLAIQEAIQAADYSKFSPEAVRFIEGWHNSIRRDLELLEERWK